MCLPLSVVVSGPPTLPLPFFTAALVQNGGFVCPSSRLSLVSVLFSIQIHPLPRFACSTVPPPPQSPHSIFLCPSLTCLLASASLQLYSFQGRPGRGMLAGKLWSCNSPFFPLQRSRFLRGLLDYFWRLGAFRVLGS